MNRKSNGMGISKGVKLDRTRVGLDKSPFVKVENGIDSMYFDDIILISNKKAFVR